MKKILSVLINLTFLVFSMQGCFADTPDNEKKVSEEGYETSSTDQSAHPKSIDNKMSKWIGVYEAEGRACRPEKLTIQNETFGWGRGCHQVKTKLVSLTEEEIILEIEENQDCSFPGKIASMKMPTPELNVLFIKAYRSMNDYKANEYKLSCTYSKVMNKGKK